MKIALCVPIWPTGGASNGIATYASQLVPALRKLGHEVFVLTAHKGDDDPYTIDLQRFSNRQGTLDRIFRRLAPEKAAFDSASSRIALAVEELVRKHALDAFEMEESFGFSLAVSKLHVAPVIVRLHGPWFINGIFDEKHKFKQRERAEGRGILNAHFVTSPSEKALRAVKSHYHFALTESRVIPNPMAPSANAHMWNVLTCDKNKLLYVGRFDRLKGADVALKAFAELMAIFPSLKLTFVGPDIGIKQQDGTLMHFEQYARRCFPENQLANIEFMGQLDHSEVMALRRQHFITIVASQHEVFPYSVLEAMSIGCPVVATQVGGIPELIKDQFNGLLVPSQDARAIVAACRQLLLDHELATRLGTQAWQDCVAIYAPENVARRTVEGYLRAIQIFKSRSS